MNCPRCNNEAVLIDEEFAHATEKTEPPRVIINTVFICKTCHEKFTRVMAHPLDSITQSAASNQSLSRILGETNFPDTRPSVDSDVLESLSSLGDEDNTAPGRNDSSMPQSPMSRMKAKMTDL